MVLLTPRSASAVRNLTLFAHLMHIIARVCATLAIRRHAVFLPQPVFASSCLLLALLFLPAVGSLFSSWVLGSLLWLFFPLSCLHRPVRGTGAATPRALCEAFSKGFQDISFVDLFSPIVVLNLGFTLIILHVVLDTFTARLVLSPCSFTLLVVLGARPCFNGLHVLSVVWWSPAPPLFSLPRAARAGRYLQSSAAPAVASRNDFMFHCC